MQSFAYNRLEGFKMSTYVKREIIVQIGHQMLDFKSEDLDEYFPAKISLANKTSFSL